MTQNFVLEYVDVHKTFREHFWSKPRQALRGLTCGFRAGHCTAVVGHNGAGKTTAIRSALGLLRPDRGRILVNGHEPTRADRALIGYMPENHKLPGNLTPWELLSDHLSLTRGIRGKALKALVGEILSKVGVGRHMHTRVSGLSKGLARRLAWAYATSHQPSLLIADEPLSGLDPVGREEMLGWFADLRRASVSILVATHDFDLVEAHCDTVHVINCGRVVRTIADLGRATEVSGQSTHSRLCVSGFSEAEAKRLHAAEGLRLWEDTQQTGANLTMSFVDYAAGSAWVQALMRHGLVVLRFDAIGELSGSRLLNLLRPELQE